MTVDKLKSLSNDKVLFEASKDSLLIRSHIYRYADFLKIADIETIERISESTVYVSIPKGSSMGDRYISVNLDTGIVTADGKVFDEEMTKRFGGAISLKSKREKPFTPSINGFSIKDVHTMPSEDGYACYCKVYFNGMKVGDFVDKGDGGEYSFYADPPYSRSKIEEVIRSFPSTNRDYGFGPMVVPYDMNQMVNDLIEMKEIVKGLRKLEGSEKD